MKKLILSLTIILASVMLRAQSFQKGDINITAGYGAPNLGKLIFKALFDDKPNYKEFGTGPMHFDIEYAISENISLGLGTNFASFGAEFTNEINGITYVNKANRVGYSILGRLNVHFLPSEKLDPYFGVAAGWRGGNLKLTSTNPEGFDFPNIPGAIPFGFEVTVGLRYYIVEPVGLYVEFGPARSLFQGGLAFSL